jgi:transcription initiation factor TFIID subunit 5
MVADRFSINCIDFSGDYSLVAAGTSQSYIRIWSTDGEPIHDDSEQDWRSTTNSKYLVGHSGPVYSVAFSPSTMNPEANSVHDKLPDDKPKTTPLYLLSGSADCTIRLWSMDAWTQLVIFKGHVGPVWDVAWDRFGYYFASAGYDRSARVWTTDSIMPHRLLVGHDGDVSVVTLHPNGTYVFTGSDDKTVRMWDGRGNPVRMFTGHTGNITAIACSPDGLSLATADDAGTIITWNLLQGRLSHRLRGHSRGGIWSLTWSVESSVLVSCGADGTVRAWDMTLDKEKEGVKSLTDVGTSLKIEGVSDNKSLAGTSTAGGVGTTTGGTVVNATGGVGSTAANGTTTGGTSTATGRKGKQRDNVVSPEQISAFPTKKSAVYKVTFTQSNLVIAGGAYLPETM